MKKTFNRALLLALVLTSFSSAETNITYVMGVIYDASDYTPVPGANVSITCNNIHSKTISDYHGAYSTQFRTSNCKIGDTAIVSAVKGDLSGTAKGIVHPSQVSFINLAIVHVPMTPEFGFIIGTLTLFASIGIFFIIRRQ